MSATPSATLTWTANTETNLAGYKVYRGLGTVAPTLLQSVGLVTTFTDSTLPAVTQNVSYNLTAFNTNGIESGHTANVTKLIDVTAPATPSGLAVTIVVVIA